VTAPSPKASPSRLTSQLSRSRIPLPGPTKLAGLAVGISAAAMLGSAGAANAAIIQYTFNNDSYSQGPNSGTLSGTFRYDTGSGAFSSINITASKSYYQSPSLATETFNTYGSGSTSNSSTFQNIIFGDSLNSTSFISISMSGGTNYLSPTLNSVNGASQFCQNSSCSTNKNLNFSGTISAVSVPSPVPFLGFAPLALLLLRKRNPFTKKSQFTLLKEPAAALSAG
jgi:hypothetical protein